MKILFLLLALNSSYIFPFSHPRQKYYRYEKCDLRCGNAKIKNTCCDVMQRGVHVIQAGAYGVRAITWACVGFFVASHPAQLTQAINPLLSKAGNHCVAACCSKDQEARSLPACNSKANMKITRMSREG